MIQSRYLSQILSIFPSMADITEEDWNQDGISVIQMEPNSIIEEGQLLDYIYMVLEGTVRMYKISPSGREITLYRIHEGECCPLMISCILGGTKFEATARVETNVVSLKIPANIFREWMERYSNLRQFIFQLLAKRIVLFGTLLDNAYFKSVRARVSDFLIDLSEQKGKADRLQITHDCLSVELGTVREVISRTLKSLEREHIIKLSRGTITILNRMALESEL